MADIRPVRIHRDAYKLHISSGILFNHESEVRRTWYVTRKISRTPARINCGLKELIILDNLYAVKD